MYITVKSYFVSIYLSVCVSISLSSFEKCFAPMDSLCPYFKQNLYSQIYREKFRRTLVFWKVSSGFSSRESDPDPVNLNPGPQLLTNNTDYYSLDAPSIQTV